MKNIGGSILPSGSPEILTVIKFDGSWLWPGNLQVVRDEAQDTHHLMLIDGDNKTLLASHPNGYSCHSLAVRMAKLDRAKSHEQAIYIIACGGSVSGVCASILNGFSPK
jgi:hypothetical protein